MLNVNNTIMKFIQNLSIFALVSLFTTAAMAQGEYDAMKFSQTDLHGSARFMSMSGAFGALGGDATAISYNPAGIGVYRSSEFTFSPTFSRTRSESELGLSQTSGSQLNLLLDGIAYVGSFRTGSNSSLTNFNFGISYNKLKDFNRTLRIHGQNRTNSLLDKVAGSLGDVQPSMLGDLPYLAYETYLINHLPGIGYESILGPGERLDNDMYFEEDGGIGVWDITLGGNWDHYLYVGGSIGIQNIHYELMSSYWESPVSNSFEYDLRNAIVTDGTGVNAKIGVIIRPFAGFRFGFAMHSPTYYYLTDAFASSLYSDLYGGSFVPVSSEGAHDAAFSENYADYQLSTPGKLLYSVAYMFGKRGLLSLDWEVIDYNSTQLRSESGFPYDETNDEIAAHTRAISNLRLGGEFRISETVSLRAGGAWYQSPYRDSQAAANTEIVTVGTTPHYSMGQELYYMTGGVGYRTGSFFLDAALVHQTAKEQFFNYYDGSNDHNDAKYANVKTNKLNVVLSTGFRF